MTSDVKTCQNNSQNILIIRMMLRMRMTMRMMTRMTRRIMIRRTYIKYHYPGKRPQTVYYRGVMCR